MHAMKKLYMCTKREMMFENETKSWIERDTPKAVAKKLRHDNLIIIQPNISHQSF